MAKELGHGTWLSKGCPFTLALSNGVIPQKETYSLLYLTPPAGCDLEHKESICYILCSFVQATITKCHRLGGLNPEIGSPTVLDATKSKIKGQQSCFFLRALSLTWRCHLLPMSSHDLFFACVS